MATAAIMAGAEAGAAIIMDGHADAVITTAGQIAAIITDHFSEEEAVNNRLFPHSGGRHADWTLFFLHWQRAAGVAVPGRLVLSKHGLSFPR